jgi:hypothetical protein
MKFPLILIGFLVLCLTVLTFFLAGGNSPSASMVPQADSAAQPQPIERPSPGQATASKENQQATTPSLPPRLPNSQAAGLNISQQQNSLTNSPSFVTSLPGKVPVLPQNLSFNRNNPSATMPTKSGLQGLVTGTSAPVYDAAGSELSTEIPVPHQVAVPAATIDTAENATPAQADALDAISEKFLDDYTRPAPANASNIAGAITDRSRWQDAAFEANQRYRGMFGVDAYNYWTSAAAKEALTD